MANRAGPLIHYTLDASASQFTAQITGPRAGTLSTPARRFSIDDFTGYAVLGREVCEGSKIQISINPCSLSRMDHLAAREREPNGLGTFDDILEIEKHPKITFEGAQASASGNGEGRYRVVIDGNLTVRGLTRPLAIEAHILYGEDSFRAYGDFQLRPADFGVNGDLYAKLLAQAAGHVTFVYFITGRKEN
jgi:polyisoprenoid-binding protein YceI